MDRFTYLTLKSQVIGAGYEDEIDWAASVGFPKTPEDFALELGWVIMCAGMKEQVVRPIWNRMAHALLQGHPDHLDDLFGHVRKVAAIKHIWEYREGYRSKFAHSLDKLEYLEGLPWIGPITKYHAAKSLGLDVCKPDRHLVRIAAGFGMTPEEMCRRLSEQTGDRIGVVDVVIWRAANLGLV